MNAISGHGGVATVRQLEVRERPCRAPSHFFIRPHLLPLRLPRCLTPTSSAVVSRSGPSRAARNRRTN